MVSLISHPVHNICWTTISCTHSAYTELQVVPTSAESSVVLSSGVVVQVTGAEGASSIVAGTVDHVAAVLPPFWPRYKCMCVCVPMYLCCYVYKCLHTYMRTYICTYVHI